MSEEKEIDFMGIRKIAAAVSGILVLVSLISLLVNSLQFGLDFTSGTSVRLEYSDTVDLSEVNRILTDSGYEEAVVVSFGSDREIRVVLPVDESTQVEDQASEAAIVGESIASLYIFPIVVKFMSYIKFAQTHRIFGS